MMRWRSRSTPGQSDLRFLVASFHSAGKSFLDLKPRGLPGKDTIPTEKLRNIWALQSKSSKTDTGRKMRAAVVMALRDIFSVALDCVGNKAAPTKATFSDPSPALSLLIIKYYMHIPLLRDIRLQTDFSTGLEFQIL